MSNLQTRESRIRRLAGRHGYRLWKVRESSPWFTEYGPYTLIDEGTSSIVAWAVDLDEIDEEFLV